MVQWNTAPFKTESIEKTKAVQSAINSHIVNVFQIEKHSFIFVTKHSTEAPSQELLMVP